VNGEVLAVNEIGCLHENKVAFTVVFEPLSAQGLDVGISLKICRDNVILDIGNNIDIVNILDLTRNKLFRGRCKLIIIFA
jgi:hypothetical protein